MKRTITYLSADKKTQIHATIWAPADAPKAILQISHGMVEYIDRYDEFARSLADHGFFVTGNDHLGHGASVISDDQHGFFAHPNGNECVIADIHALRELTQKQFPDVPYFMLGHSMGSFLLRQYMQEHGEGLSGAIIMGTGAQPGLMLHIGKLLCRMDAALFGWGHVNAFIDNLSCGSFNKQFEPAKSPADWLSKDIARVNAYCNHPWCAFHFTVNGYYHMFRGIQKAQAPGRIAQIPKALPLLLVSGDCDPVGHNGKDVKQVYEIYKNAGIRDVSMKLYENDRHEILNETDREVVYEELRAWLERHI